MRLYLAEAMCLVWAEAKARLAVARGMAEDRYALTLAGLFALQNAEGGQLELALEG